MIDLTNQMIYRLGNLNTEQNRISYQMSTGKVLDRGSDDSSLYSQELYVNDKIRVYSGLQTQIEKTNAQNNVTDSSMGEVKNILDAIKQDMLQALNAGMDPNDKKATAVNINGMRENLLTLANESVNGEHLFAGTDTSIRPFTKDPNTGAIEYHGDARSRTIAVEPNTYRERGITGIDAFYYTANSAEDATSQLEFLESETIIDESGLEWIQPKATVGNRFTFDVNDTIIDDAGNTWNLNTTTNQLDSVPAGFNIDVVNLEGDKWQTVSTIAGNGPSGALASLEADNVTSTTPPAAFAGGNLRQMGPTGVLTGDELSYTGDGGTPETFKTAAINSAGAGYNAGDTLSAKHSIFDDIDEVINALNTNDDVLLRDSLDKIDKSYDAANVAHSKLGGRNKIFEVSLERVTSKLTHFNILSQEVSGADLAKVAMEAKALEMTYTALYSTITKMNNLTLVNFVK